jgi:hypothetical protein
MLNDNIAKRLPPVWEETLARSLTSQAQNAHKIFANNAHKNQNDFWLGALGALGAGMTGGGSITVVEAPHFSQPTGKDTLTSDKKAHVGWRSIAPEVCLLKKQKWPAKALNLGMPTK